MYGKYAVDSFSDDWDFDHENFSSNSKYIFEGEYSEADVITSDNGVVLLERNHANTDKEIDDMTRFIGITRNMLGLERTGKGEGDIDEAEKRLGIEIPKAVKEFYNALDGDYKFILESKTQKLLPPDKIFIDGNRLIFAQKGRKNSEYFGFNLKNGHLRADVSNPLCGAGWNGSFPSFCELMIVGAAMTAIQRMPVNRYYKVRGKDNLVINTCELVENSVQSILKRYDGHYFTFSSIMINEETKSLAYLRKHLISSDIYIGAKSEDIIQKFRELRGMDKD